MKKFFKVLNNIEEIFLLPSFCFSVALLFIQVVARYVFKSSLTWSEELARYLFVWQIWIGISYCVKNNSHIRVTLLKDLLGKKANKVLEVIVLVIWFGFGCFVINQGYANAMRIAGFGQKSSALQIPMQYAYAAIPVGAALMNIRLVQNIIKLFKEEVAA